MNVPVSADQGWRMNYAPNTAGHCWIYNNCCYLKLLRLCQIITMRRLFNNCDSPYQNPPIFWITCEQ